MKAIKGKFQNTCFSKDRLHGIRRLYEQQLSTNATNMGPMKIEDTTQTEMARLHRSDLAEATIIPRESLPEEAMVAPQE